VWHPYRLLHRISKVIGFQVDQLTPGVYKSYHFKTFFSHDILDIKWLPKFSRRKKIDEVDYNKKLMSLVKYNYILY
jgi:hypothetical protein